MIRLVRTLVLIALGLIALSLGIGVITAGRTVAVSCPINFEHVVRVNPWDGVWYCRECRVEHDIQSTVADIPERPLRHKVFVPVETVPAAVDERDEQGVATE